MKKSFFNLVLLSTMRKVIEIKAFLRKESFYCNSLRGISNENLSINCDLSLSCNCNDYTGEGKLGSLEDNSLKGILSGKKANYLRNALEKGKMPIINCVMCTDKKTIKKEAFSRNLKEFQTKIPEIRLENTSLCNLKCLSCNRKMILSRRKRHFLKEKEIKIISKMIKLNKIKSVAYFNLGEPFFSEKIFEEIKTLKKDNPSLKISVSTNGILLNNTEKINAALMMDEVIFSIHGSSQKSASRYQKGINFEKAYQNMRNLVAEKNKRKEKKEKTKIKWKYVLFRWNDSRKDIERAIRLAKKAGVDEIFFEKTFSPVGGISLKYQLGIGYLSRFGKFKDRKLPILINHQNKNMESKNEK